MLILETTILVESSERLKISFLFQTEHVQDALYSYLQLLLRDRIHLVNRYERLRAVDPEQAERKRISIHERLRFIVDRITDALNQLRRYPNLQTKIQPRLGKREVIY